MPSLTLREILTGLPYVWGLNLEGLQLEREGWKFLPDWGEGESFREVAGR